MCIILNMFSQTNTDNYISYYAWIKILSIGALPALTHDDICHCHWYEKMSS